MKYELMGLEDFAQKDQKAITTMVAKITEAAELPDYTVNISLVDEETMKDLCLRFKKKKKVTDVLSFPTPPMEKLFEHSKNFLGDVVICTEQARTQASDLGHSFLEEVAVLSAHGLFHLLGYDHEISEEEASMQMQGEMYLLEKAGLSAELCLIGRV